MIVAGSLLALLAVGAARSRRVRPLAAHDPALGRLRDDLQRALLHGHLRAGHEDPAHQLRRAQLPLRPRLARRRAHPRRERESGPAALHRDRPQGRTSTATWPAWRTRRWWTSTRTRSGRATGRATARGLAASPRLLPAARGSGLPASRGRAARRSPGASSRGVGRLSSCGPTARAGSPPTSPRAPSCRLSCGHRSACSCSGLLTLGGAAALIYFGTREPRAPAPPATDAETGPEGVS